MADKHCLICYGGISTEHDISVITALQVYYRAKKEFLGEEILLVYLSKDGKWYVGDDLKKFETYKNFNSKNLKEVCFLAGSDNLYLKKKNKLKSLFKIDYVINSFHGGAGEDGRFASFLTDAKIINSSSCAKALAVCMDKYLTKCVCLDASVPVIDFFMIYKKEWQCNNSSVLQSLNQFDFPVVVKPCSQGSSIGVSFASNYNEFEKAVELAFNYDDSLMIERAVVKKREFNVIAAKTNGGKIITKIDEPITKSVVISFSDKYLAGGGTKKCKGALASDFGMEHQDRKNGLFLKTKNINFLHKTTKGLYELIGLNGIVRFDYIMDEDSGKIYLGEINSVPGSLGLYFFEKEDVLKDVYECSNDYWENEFKKTNINLAPKIFK